MSISKIYDNCILKIQWVENTLEKLHGKDPSYETFSRRMVVNAF